MEAAAALTAGCSCRKGKRLPPGLHLSMQERQEMARARATATGNCPSGEVECAVTADCPLLPPYLSPVVFHTSRHRSCPNPLQRIPPSMRVIQKAHLCPHRPVLLSLLFLLCRAHICLSSKDGHVSAVRAAVACIYYCYEGRLVWCFWLVNREASGSGSRAGRILHYMSSNTR